MKKITIALTGEQENMIECQIEGDWGIEDLYTVLLSTLGGQTDHFFEAASKTLSEDEQQALKGGIYDRLNYAFARVLDDILPPSEDITTEAILKAENELINEKYDALSEKQKNTAVDKKRFVENIDENN